MENLSEARILEVVGQGIEKNRDIKVIKILVEEHTDAIKDLSAVVERHGIDIKANTDAIKDLSAVVEGHGIDIKANTDAIKDLSAIVEALKAITEKHTTAIIALDKRSHSLGLMMEELRDNVRLLVEGLAPLMEKSAAMADIDHAMKSNHDQIRLTQKALKNHIKDKTMHPEKL